MIFKSIFFTVFFNILGTNSWAQIDFFHAPLVEDQRKAMIEDPDDVIVNTTVKDVQKNQELKFDISGLHPEQCSIALRKLSQYETYPKYIDFVKEAKWDSKTSFVWFYLDHTLMPYPMNLTFKIPRITQPGVYPFTFDRGILKDLKGDIHVSEIVLKPSNKKRCFFYTTASWSGPSTGINNTVFEIFATTLSKISMKKLFQISKF